MIHPDTELRFVSPDVGYGVFATRLIPRGTVVWTLCDLDLRLTPAQVTALAPAYRAIVDKYAYLDAAGQAILCWDFGRYVNHSCDPTDVAVGPAVELAVRDIRPGEQVTCDYGLGNLAEELRCRCGARGCRGVIRPEDVLVHGSAWDGVAREVLPWAARVPQPLRPFIKDAAGFDACVRGEAPLASHRSLYCPQRWSIPTAS